MDFGKSIKPVTRIPVWQRNSRRTRVWVDYCGIPEKAGGFAGAAGLPSTPSGM